MFRLISAVYFPFFAGARKAISFQFLSVSEYSPSIHIGQIFLSRSIFVVIALDVWSSQPMLPCTPTLFCLELAKWFRMPTEHAGTTRENSVKHTSTAHVTGKLLKGHQSEGSQLKKVGEYCKTKLKIYDHKFEVTICGKRQMLTHECIWAAKKRRYTPFLSPCIRCFLPSFIILPPNIIILL